MPWTSIDADRFKKGLSRKQKKRWATVANSALESCKDTGGQDCEARAIKIANSKFQEFNPLLSGDSLDKIEALFRKKFEEEKSLDLETRQAMAECMEEGGLREECMEKAKKKSEMRRLFGDLYEIEEMEIFRVGTHNGDDFTEDDLLEISANFHKLKDEIRPKLKITHHGDDDEQVNLAGLASYGDIVDVLVKEDEYGEKRLYCKIANVPKQVMDWIHQGRFAERSIEIYPQFRLGTKKDAPEYRNVLKAVALLGHEMPAVTGMAPIRLMEFYESQKTICFKGLCVPCEDWQNASNAVLLFEEQLRKEVINNNA